MSRTACILLLALAGGCGQSEIAPTGEYSKSSEDTGQSEQVSAFNFSKAEGIISLDTRIPPRQIRRFDIPMGSVTLETLEMKNDSLIFRYTPEIERGYTIYECTVPASASPVRSKLTWTPGETSFGPYQMSRSQDWSVAAGPRRFLKSTLVGRGPVNGGFRINRNNGSSNSVSRHKAHQEIGD